MNDNINFETFLFISPKKIAISIKTKSDFNKIYFNEIKFQKDLKQIDFEIIHNFLNDNIFKIEKLLKEFVKKIYLIIETNDFFSVKISIKKNNHENFIDLKSLNHLLNEAKVNCKKTIDDRKIIHMLIEGYQINENYFSNLPKNLICKNFSLDVNFICLPNNLIRNLEKTLKNFQISLNRIVSAKYVKKFIENDNQDLFNMSKKIIEGHNENEVILVDKIPKNKGFFERFFNFFN